MGCDIEDWGHSERYTQDFSYSYDMKPGGRLYLESFNGSVEISGWDRETAEITGTKYASSQRDQDALKIDIVTSEDSVRVRTVRPSERRGGMGARYVIRVPRRTSLEQVQTSNGRISVQDIEGDARLHTSNGRVVARGLHGNLKVETSNGKVEADLIDGAVVIRTSNGSVSLTLDAPPKKDVEIKSSNGSITLRMPDNAGGRVEAHTSNSSVSSEFNVATTKEARKNELEGTIGGGGPTLRLSTSNGSIKLLKRP
jgi:DUF4097 and DUF4098 domain-containing protein YvlB